MSTAPHFLNNAWYVALWSEELKPGQLVPRTVLNTPLVFYRTSGGQAVALTDICPHKFAPLHLGKLVDGDRVQCGYHGLEFGPTGACERNPHGNEHIPKACAVRSYPVVERRWAVWVWVGDEPADPAKIPDLSFLDKDPSRVTRRDVLRMESNFRLVADNLMDLSHSPFLHEGTIGNSETVKADIRVTDEDGSVAVHRDKKNVKPTGLIDRIYRRDGARVDMWSTIRWRPPGYIVNDVGAFPPGGDRSEGAGLLGVHLLTPETERSTLYHFVAVTQGRIHDDGDGQVALNSWISDVRRTAFGTQDEPVIQAQQEMMRRYPALTAKPVMLATDAGPLRCNRALDRLIMEEQERAAKNP